MALALAAADCALRIEPARPEALFNRALALEALGLDFAATAAWHRYLKVDPGSPWAVEARGRLRATEAPTRDDAWKTASVEIQRAAERHDRDAIERITRRFPQHVRLVVEGTYLRKWGEAFLTGDTRSEQWLFLARSAGAALRDANSDHLLHDIVSSIESRDSNLRSLAYACAIYGQARDDYAARKFRESLPRFSEAEKTFAAMQNPMELIAAYYRANALVDLGEPEDAERIAERLEARIDPTYRSLTAHLLWLQARIANDGGHYYETLLTATRAREIFEKLGEVDYAARLRTGEAAMLARLGRDRDAWRARRAALAEAAKSGKWSLIEVAIEAIARDEIEGPNADVARSLFDVQVAAPSDLPMMRFNGLLWHAFLDARTTGNLPDTRAARNAATRIPDPKQRADAMDELRLAEAFAMRESNPIEAERLLGEVIDYRIHNHLLPHLPAIHVQRGCVRRALSRLADAEQDFLDAIQLTESRRATIRNDTLRDAFLGHSSDAYVELCDLLIERGNWRRAFEIAERARARILLDRAGRDAVSLADVAARIPPDVIVAHYTTLPSRSLLVIIADGKTTAHRINAGSNELRSLRDRLTVAIDSDQQAEATRLANRLDALLIEPLRPHLNGKKLLVAVPDESTYGIPFAALRNGHGHLLIERIALAIAPTAAAVPNQLPLPRNGTTTVLADPAFSLSVFPDLDRLPAARRGVPTFGTVVQLTGADATARALENAARDSNIIHIAAHALSSERDASLSMIALAPSEGDNGVLDLQDIRSLRLQRTPLVVLAGCQTGSLGGGTGSIRTLAHAFLAAGSGAVLATLWNIDDRSASDVTSRFYRSLSAGATVPTALRESQLEAMRSHPLREWAAFQIHIGIPATKERS